MPEYLLCFSCPRASQSFLTASCVISPSSLALLAHEVLPRKPTVLLLPFQLRLSSEKENSDLQQWPAGRTEGFLWGSNFTERKIEERRLCNPFFFLLPLRNEGHPICKRTDMCDGVCGWMTRLLLQCSQSTHKQKSLSLASCQGVLFSLFVYWLRSRKERVKVLNGGVFEATVST